jgi:uncharacterized membrane protein YfhO
MNYDESWSASARPGGALAVLRQADTVAAKIPAGTSRVTFKYYPRGLNLGLFLFAATAGALALLWRRERRIG